MLFAREYCAAVAAAVKGWVRKLSNALDPSARLSQRRVVALDPLCAGEQVAISNFTVGGRGSVLANCGLHQGRAYWEMRVLEFGPDSRAAAGVCVKQPPGGGFYNADSLLSSSSSSSSSSAGGGGGAVAWTCGFGFGEEAAVRVKTGDVVGVAYDQSDVPVLTVYVNGSKAMETAVKGAGGRLLFPVFSVSGGARAHVNFGPDSFDAPAGVPHGFSGIIKAVDLV